MKNKKMYFQRVTLKRTLFSMLSALRLACVLLFALPLMVSAEGNKSQLIEQQKTISGVVLDNLGDPLIGVSVSEKGTANGTITDIEGKYSINIVGDKVTLIYSFIGLTPKEVVVGSQTSINVRLEEDSKLLDEVVVVSYGTQKKRDMTGAISKVEGSALSDMPVSQIGQKLQGQAAGVQINQTTGRPGEGMGFRIRGASSINASNKPLFVVDGFVLGADINKLNPDEIESFTILKDAAATSLYGSRAANGVIIITTKKGKEGKTKVDFSATFGVQSMKGLKAPDVMNGTDFAQYEKEFYEDKAKYEGYTGGVPEAYQNPEQYGKGTDWYKTMLRDAPTQNYSLSISTGVKDKLRSAIMLGYFQQDGVLYNTDFERFSLRANNEFQVNESVKLSLNVAPSLQLANNQNSDGGWNLLSGAMLAFPTVSPYDDNGDLKVALSAPNMFGQPNWLRALKEKTNLNKATTILANAALDVDIWNGISYKLQGGVDTGSSNNRSFTPSTATGGMMQAPPRKAYGAYSSTAYYNWTVENMLMYGKEIDKHRFDLLAGYSAEKNIQEYVNLNGNDFPDDSVPWMDAATTKNGENNTTKNTLASVIGRVNYAYADKYLFQATFRRDGSSRFGTDRKYANFPSVSAGWIISEESFMQPINSVMNYLKLRASYGTTGNNDIGNYTYIPVVQKSDYVFNNALVPGSSLASIGNPLLTWEENKQFDIGVDFSFLNDRIFVMYDFYSKKTNDMLYQIDIPRASGFADIKYNVGDFKSRGHEFTISSRNLVGEFSWKTDFNISFNKNEITRLGTTNTPIGGYEDWAGDFNRLQVGQPIGVFVGYVYDGVYMTEEEFSTQPKHADSQVGTVRYKDVSGPDGVPDGKITADDRTIIGDPNPDFIFGITNEFRYKDFDLNIIMTGAVGGDIMNGNLEYTENLDGVFNVAKAVANRWRSLENPGDGKIPRTLAGTTGLFRANTSRAVEDGSYLAIKNVTLGYNVPLKENRYVSKLRLHLSVQQLAVFTKYSGINPEVTSSSMGWKGMGVDRMNYPVPRTFSIGCNVTF